MKLDTDDFICVDREFILDHDNWSLIEMHGVYRGSCLGIIHDETVYATLYHSIETLATVLNVSKKIRCYSIHEMHEQFTVVTTCSEVMKKDLIMRVCIK